MLDMWIIESNQCERKSNWLVIVPVEKKNDKSECSDEKEDPNAKSGILAHRFSQLFVAFANVLSTLNSGAVQLVQIQILFDHILREHLLKPGYLGQLARNVTLYSSKREKHEI